MSKDSVYMSEKHGLNPSMLICFWCGEPKGIALMGKLKGDVEAPRNVVADYEPCDKCQADMETGITVMSVSETPTGYPEIQKGAYPTGSWSVITEEGLRHMIPESEAELIERVLKARKLLLTSTMYDQIFSATNTPEEE